MKTEKTFENEGGNILVRFAPKNQVGRCGIVEMLHLFDKNKSGCVICAWVVRKVDGEPTPEIQVVHNRLTSTQYSFDILEALKYGQKLAEDIIYYEMDL
jgi:hypothetical protein